MDTIIKILHAITKKHWPIALHVFLIALLCAAIYPIVMIVAGINGDGSSLWIKIILMLGCVAVGTRILPGRSSMGWMCGWSALPQWQRCAVPFIISIAVILILGAIPPSRPLGIAISMIISSVGVLVIAVYAFCTRFLYAAFVEAPSSKKADLADSEEPAKEVFRTILAILAWEWFAAWYLITFSPTISVTTAMIAFFSLGIVALTSYSLGFKGETGQKVLLYGALGIFIAVSLVLVDKTVQEGHLKKFLTSGYIGSQFTPDKTQAQQEKMQKVSPLPQKTEDDKTKDTKKSPESANEKIGILGWMIIFAIIIILGRMLAYSTGNAIFFIIAIYIIILLTIYFAGRWVVGVYPEIFSQNTVDMMIGGKIPDDIKDVSIARRWFWVLGIIGEITILFAGLWPRTNSRKPKRQPLRFHFAKMVIFFLCLFVFDWFYWAGGSTQQICDDLNGKWTVIDTMCKNKKQASDNQRGDLKKETPVAVEEESGNKQVSGKSLTQTGQGHERHQGKKK